MNAIGWFEIPVHDMKRAIEFYNHVFETELTRMPMGVLDMATFPWDNTKHGASGALVHHPDFYKPSDEAGVVIYFSSPDVHETLLRVIDAGGTIIQEKTQISEDVGYMGLFLDSEGNRLALHSRS